MGISPGVLCLSSSLLVYFVLHHLPWCILSLIISPGVSCHSSTPLVYLVFYHLPWCILSFIISPGVSCLLSSPLVIYSQSTTDSNSYQSRQIWAIDYLSSGLPRYEYR